MAYWNKAVQHKTLSGRSERPVRSGPVPSRAQGLPRMTEDEILENAYGVPILQPPLDPRGPRHAGPSRSDTQSRHGHERSTSHQFPLLFSGKKKDSAGPAVRSSDDDSPQLYNPLRSSPIKAPESSRVDEELVTGRCMTCDSGVKWPKGLSVFRCTVCRTINDIELPINTGESRLRVPPISVHRTKRIIDHCLQSYLRLQFQRNQETLGHHQSGDLFSTNTVFHDSFVPLPVSTSQQPAKDAPHASLNPGRNVKLNAHLKFDLQTSGKNDRSQGSSSPYPQPLLTGAGPHAQSGQDGKQTREELPNQARQVFRPLEEYIVSTMQHHDCLNASFISSNLRPITTQAASGPVSQSNEYVGGRAAAAEGSLSMLDAKTLMLGGFAENGSWWTGNHSSRHAKSRTQGGENPTESQPPAMLLVHARSPKIDWEEVNHWYRLITNVAAGWESILEQLVTADGSSSARKAPEPEHIRRVMYEGQAHIQRVLLKVTENLLKRPGLPLRDPNNIRFLLILLANPLLHPNSSSVNKYTDNQKTSYTLSNAFLQAEYQAAQHLVKGIPGQHSGIIKRILGLLSNLDNACHHHLISWFSRFSEAHFRHMTELIGSFVTYRMTRQHTKRREIEQDLSGGLIPTNLSSGQALYDALGSAAQSTTKLAAKARSITYQDDWQIRAASRVMQLLSIANNNGNVRRPSTIGINLNDLSRGVTAEARKRAHRHGQILATSDFYNTLLDYSDIIADFEAWESKKAKFTFCQYPFFISIGAKIKILAYDARRQQEVKAREAFFDSIMTKKSLQQYLVLKVRRDCLVEDSLRGVGSVVGAGGEEIKKGLRIEFQGEEGVDAGGLRKEWFLLLVRELFNPEHGMFTYDEDSRFCYFNPNSFETTDQFFLVGVVLGLAIYNSTILDVALPPFVFRKLLAAGPVPTAGLYGRVKPAMSYTLDDLAEFRPVLTRGLRHLLEFEGDVESTFCRDFVADVDRYGQASQVPLCEGGELRPVTNENRREFVDLYVRYLLDSAVARQFEPFKRGFWQVCAGNGLSLFQPEEIELLVRGSEESLDIESLSAVAIYENWEIVNKDHVQEPAIQWFWQSFREANTCEQRKLLGFITGSDRIPATGTANLVIKVSCLGNDDKRFPIARTCFNTLMLPRYRSYQDLQTKMWRAVHESEGFGLK